MTDKPDFREEAEKYARETQEKLNSHLGVEVIPAWGPVAAAFQAGSQVGYERGRSERESDVEAAMRIIERDTGEIRQLKQQLAERDAEIEINRLRAFEEGREVFRERLREAEEALKFYADTLGWDNGKRSNEPSYERARAYFAKHASSNANQLGKGETQTCPLHGKPGCACG